MTGLRDTVRRARDEDGLGLPELIVTMALMGMVSMLVLGLFTTFTRAMTRDRAESDSTSVASIGMNELTRVVRAGTEIRLNGSGDNVPVFLAAGNESMVLHAFLDTSSASPRPLKVEFTVNATRQLIERRWNATASTISGTPHWTFGSVAASQRRIASQITPRVGSEKWLFTYRSELVCPAANPDCNVIPVPAGGITDPNVLRTIALVELRLRVQADGTGRADPVLLTNQVGLPNRGVDRVGASL